MQVYVGGFCPFTTLDFPDYLAAVVFFQGCPWRCSYCHNPHLLEKGREGTDQWGNIVQQLKVRRRFLQGVVFSGGEPLAQKDIWQAAMQIKAMGYKLALHTNGAYPDRLKAMLPMLDWVGLDIKAPAKHYPELVGAINAASKVQQSLNVLLDNNVDFEVRTTWDENLYSYAELVEIGNDLAARGVSHWAVQKMRHEGCLRMPTIEPSQWSRDELASHLERQCKIEHLTVRH